MTKEYCTFPDCNCPLDPQPDKDWCAKKLPKSQKGLHDWEMVSAGMYDDLYKCNKCGETYMTQADNYEKWEPPKGGCKK